MMKKYNGWVVSGNCASKWLPSTKLNVSNIDGRYYVVAISKNKGVRHMKQELKSQEISDACEEAEIAIKDHYQEILSYLTAAISEFP